MHISWLGGTGLKIQSKPQNDDVTVLIDPYKPEHGTAPRNLTAEIVLLSQGNRETIGLSGDPFILATPGECEIKGVLLSVAAGPHEDSTIIRIDSEGLSLAHLGLSSKIPNDEALEVIGSVDILCLPVGGGSGYTPEMAGKVISMIEPRIVIPYGYQSDNDPDAVPLEKFLKEMGAMAVTPEKKLIIKKKDLISEDTKVMVLEKE